ncbi:MAG: hypothetical protein ACKOOG_07145 [Actinomycetota bacterium]
MAFGAARSRVVVADVDEAGGAETVAMVQAVGGEALFIRTDVTDPAQVAAMVSGCFAA